MMATFTSAAAFVDNIAKYGTKVKAAEPKALKAAALAAVNDIRKEAGPFHITRPSGAKVPLKAGFEVAGSRATIEPRPRGAWTIIEVGTAAHDISPRRKGRRRRAALSVPGYGSGVLAVVHHKGARSSGKPWAHGVAKAKRSAPDAFNDAIRKAVR